MIINTPDGRTVRFPESRNAPVVESWARAEEGDPVSAPAPEAMCGHAIPLTQACEACRPNHILVVDHCSRLRERITLWCRRPGRVGALVSPFDGALLHVAAARLQQWTTPACPRCAKLIQALGRSLSALAQAHQTPAMEQAQEREYARRQAGWRRDYVIKDAQKIVDRLRRGADDLQTRLDRFAGRPGEGNKDEAAYQMAAQFLHDITWLIPNLNLDGLLHNALEYDESVRQSQEG